MGWQAVFANPLTSVQQSGRAVGRAELDAFHRLERAGSAPPWPGRRGLSRHARAVADALGEWDETSARDAYEEGRRATKRVFDNPTPVARAMQKIRALHDEGVSWEAAARTFMIRYPRLALDVMDRVGNWPSSEPEIRALQEVWR